MSHTTIPRPNTDQRQLIQRVIDVLRSRPNAFYMGSWISEDASGQTLASPDAREWPEECGTTACIAGHACLLSGLTVHTAGAVSTPEEGLFYIEEAASQRLGLPVCIFHTARWPPSFASRSCGGPDAGIAADLLTALLDPDHPVWKEIEDYYDGK